MMSINSFNLIKDNCGYIMLCMDNEFLTVNEFAKMAKLSRLTVINLINEGKICHFRTSNGPKAQYRIKASEIERLISWELHKITMKKSGEK